MAGKNIQLASKEDVKSESSGGCPRVSQTALYASAG